MSFYIDFLTNLKIYYISDIMQEEIYSLFVANVQSVMYCTISIANVKNTYKYNDVTPNPSTCMLCHICNFNHNGWMLYEKEIWAHHLKPPPPQKKKNQKKKNFQFFLFSNLKKI